MFRDQQEVAAEALELRPRCARSEPRLAETEEGPVLGLLLRIAGDAVDPGIADLLGDDRQAVANRSKSLRECVHGRRLDPGVRKACRQRAVDVLELVGGLRSDVVVGMGERQGVGQAGHDHDVAVVALVHHDDLGPAGWIPPDEHGRDVGRRGRGIDPDVEELDAGLGEQRDDPARVPGDVGHLGGDRALAEPRIQSLGQAEPEPEQGRVHVLAEQAERQGMPGNVPGLDRGLHPPATGAVGPLEVLVDQPRARRPDEPRRRLVRRASGRPWPGRAHLFAEGDRLGDELVHVPRDDGRREVAEPDVEVGLEHDVHAIDRLVDGAAPDRRREAPRRPTTVQAVRDVPTVGGPDRAHVPHLRTGRNPLPVGSAVRDGLGGHTRPRIGRPGRRCDPIVSDRNPALVRRTVFKPSIAKRTVSRQGR